MSVLAYITESLYKNTHLAESQKEAKQLAQSGKNPNFGMDEVNKLKEILGDPKLFKYMGWISKNWDDLPIESLGEYVSVYDENVGGSSNNLKPMKSYKNKPNDWVRDVKRVIANDKNKTSEIPSDQRVKTLWTSDDGNIRVVVPQTKTASVKQGQGSRWCTAANTDKGNDYDPNHMFCLYVLDTNGLMIYIINDNLPEDDKFHKTAIRLIDSYGDGVPEIAEIKDMTNTTDYSNSNGVGWNSEYEEYLNEYNIPLDAILNTIHHEMKEMEPERNQYKQQHEMDNAIRRGDMRTIEHMIDSGFIPRSNELNTAISTRSTDLVEYFLDNYKTVKPNDSTMKILLRSWSYPIYNIIKDLPTLSYENVNLSDVIQITEDLDVIKRAVEGGAMLNKDNIGYVMKSAFETRDPEIIKYVYNIDGVEQTPYTYKHAEDNQKYIEGTPFTDLADELGIVPGYPSLHEAIRAKDVDLVKKYVDAGAEPKNTRIPALSTIYLAIKSGNPEIIKLIRDSGATISDDEGRVVDPVIYKKYTNIPNGIEYAFKFLGDEDSNFTHRTDLLPGQKYIDLANKYGIPMANRPPKRPVVRKQNDE